MSHYKQIHKQPFIVRFWPLRGVTVCSGSFFTHVTLLASTARAQHAVHTVEHGNTAVTADNTWKNVRRLQMRDIF